MSDLVRRLREGVSWKSECEISETMNKAADEIDRLETELREANGKLMADDMLLEEKRELIAMMNSGDVPLDGDLWLAMRDARDGALEACNKLQSIASKLLDERDVLALNFGQKETGVLVLLDNEDEVVGVAWTKPGNMSGSDNCTRLPKRFSVREDAAEAAMKEQTETEDE